MRKSLVGLSALSLGLVSYLYFGNDSCGPEGISPEIEKHNSAVVERVSLSCPGDEEIVSEDFRSDKIFRGLEKLEKIESFQYYDLEGVVNSSAGPVANVQVTLGFYETPGHREPSVYRFSESDMNGIFKFENVFEGKHQIYARVPGEFFSDEVFVNEDVKGVEVYFNNVLRVTGRIVDESGFGIYGARMRMDNCRDYFLGFGSVVYEGLEEEGYFDLTATTCQALDNGKSLIRIIHPLYDDFDISERVMFQSSGYFDLGEINLGRAMKFDLVRGPFGSVSYVSRRR